MIPRIIVDAGIPRAGEYLATLGQIEMIPGHRIDREVVRRAHGLIVRSTTRIDEDLLKGSTVQFVGSATAGIDHIDLPFLERAGISFAHAPGANARSVTEYVLTALFSLSARYNTVLKEKTVGVVGCGAVGEQLVGRLRALGIPFLRNDPPRARSEAPIRFAALERIIEECDVVTLHVPLTRTGRDPTWHLFGNRELAGLSKNSWLINTARGGVVDEEALPDFLAFSEQRAVVLDVWETEPSPDRKLFNLIDFGTPHIAGYSYDAKLRATRVVAEAAASFFGGKIPADWSGESGLIPLTEPSAIPDETPDRYANELLRQMYDLSADHLALGEVLRDPSGAKRIEGFRRLRDSYQIRRSFSNFMLSDPRQSSDLRRRLVHGLGIVAS